MDTSPPAQPLLKPLVAVGGASLVFHAGWLVQRVAEEAWSVDQISQDVAVHVGDHQFQKYTDAEVICLPSRAVVSQCTNERVMLPLTTPSSRSVAPLRSTVSFC